MDGSAPHEDYSQVDGIQRVAGLQSPFPSLQSAFGESRATQKLFHQNIIKCQRARGLSGIWAVKGLSAASLSCLHSSCCSSLGQPYRLQRTGANGPEQDSTELEWSQG